MRAQVVFLEQTPAKEVEAVLKPLMSPAGNIGLGGHNSVVLVDNPENLDKLLKLIYLMDSRALSDTMVRIIKVQNTDPGEIIREMETIFSAYGNLAQKGKESSGSASCLWVASVFDPGQFPAFSRACLTG
jgi:type II secretory pathway component GspD/PulD (secretin)